MLYSAALVCVLGGRRASEAGHLPVCFARWYNRCAWWLVAHRYLCWFVSCCIARCHSFNTGQYGVYFRVKITHGNTEPAKTDSLRALCYTVCVVGWSAEPGGTGAPPGSCVLDFQAIKSCILVLHRILDRDVGDVGDVDECG
jgi:hypothetical protein